MPQPTVRSKEDTERPPEPKAAVKKRCGTSAGSKPNTAKLQVRERTNNKTIVAEGGCHHISDVRESYCLSCHLSHHKPTIGNTANTTEVLCAPLRLSKPTRSTRTFSHIAFKWRPDPLNNCKNFAMGRHSCWLPAGLCQCLSRCSTVATGSSSMQMH